MESTYLGARNGWSNVLRNVLKVVNDEWIVPASSETKPTRTNSLRNAVFREMDKHLLGLLFTFLDGSLQQHLSDQLIHCLLRW